MYESYWQLDQKPFENTADPQFYFPGETHEAALLKLRYAVENRRGGALLSGAAGTGKTFILSMLHQSLGENYVPFIHLVYPQMTPAELLAYLADEFDGGGNTGIAVHETIRRIQGALRENAEKGRHAVVVIDEAHLLENSQMLETLRMLLNFGPDGKTGMTLLLAGQPGILPLLDRTPQLEERLGVKCLLRPFTASETGQYITHRLQVAGAAQPIISEDAVPTLFELTRGIARQINRLGDLALLVGFAEEQQTLSAAHFEAVCRELVAVTPE
ncbi:MAG: ExeA family protein [Thermoguttaceae bacterium]